MKFLFVGLGNVGMEYDATRHNIGFDVLDAFAIKHGVTFKTERLAMHAEISWKGKRLHLIKPTTYMNLSGRAMKYWMEKEKVALENCLVVVDDLALPLATLRLRGKGAHAGHNGLRDIEAMLGSNVYNRLRFGIGDDFPKGRQVDFVLGRWDANEMPFVKEGILKALEVLESFVTVGLSRTMTSYNQK